MVAESAMVATFLTKNLSDIPCSLMQKLPRDIQLLTRTGLMQTLPKHSKFLRFSAIVRVEDQSGAEGAFEVAFGLPWSPSTFIQQACKVGHPLSRGSGLPDDLQKAIDKHMEWTDLQMSNYRIAWCRKWIKRAKELEAAAKADLATRHPNIAEVTQCKRLLLTQEILEDFGYEDTGALKLLREGATLAGKVDPCAVFQAQFKPGLITLQQLEQSAPQRNALVLRMTTAHEDPSVDEQLLRETKVEVEKGWAEGPYQVDQLEEGATISRRFALQQKSKLRMIDDFSISGVNDSCEAETKLDLHMVDTFCSLVRRYFKQCSDGGLDSCLQAKTYDLKSAYRQVPIAPGHYKYAYFCLYNVELQCTEIYRLRTMPFGATHSVYGFLRLAKLLHAIACRALFLLCTNFYDDFILASKDSLCQSASNSLELVFELTGWMHDKDGKKSTSFGKYCKALGVEFNFSRTESKLLAVSNTESRKDELVKQIGEVIDAGVMDKQQTLILRGRLGFADSFLHGRLGRLVLTKLMEHAYGRSNRIDADLRLALRAMAHRLEHAKPRQVTTADNNQWFVYTDASYEQADKLGGTWRSSSRRTWKSAAVV